MGITQVLSGSTIWEKEFNQLAPLKRLQDGEMVRGLHLQPPSSKCQMRDKLDGIGAK